MTLKEIRKEKGLTQSETALLLGIPLRTYKRYENDKSYKGNYKYEMIVNDLYNKTLVDEEHGILTLDTIKKIVIPVLEKYNIKYCYLFGGYSQGKALENSDVDLLVDTNITGFEFLTIIEELRTKLFKKVDLLRLKDIQPNNPIALEILSNGIKIL